MTTKQWITTVLALLIVALGQPATFWPFGIAASIGGVALFWYGLVDIEKGKKRILIGTLWFSLVQIIQLSWVTSHPYIYSYLVLFLFSLGMGLQFGYLCFFVRRPQIEKPQTALFVAALWTLLEWARLFFLSGNSWNPIGLTLASSFWGLQTAAFWGAYGMSFWVIFVNLMGLRAIELRQGKPAIAYALCAVFPYIAGGMHFAYHEKRLSEQEPKLSALLVQTAFPIEEEMQFASKNDLVAFVIDEWKKILGILSTAKGPSVALIALPEFTVPFGTYSYVYPADTVKKSFEEAFGSDSLTVLPALAPPLAKRLSLPHQTVWLVNNAYWTQAIANIFDADVVIGLEDAEQNELGEIAYYSAAIHLTSDSKDSFQAGRYEKQVLVPMGEYIPFEWCRTLASWYGINGSFTPVKGAKLMHCRGTPFGVNICYEETFGHLIAENRRLGADFLLNLTSDVWYPNSSLTRQHLEHARLRTVENGVPLLRACNTGITCAIDSLGRTTAELGAGHPNQEWLAEALYVDIPSYTYQTIYSKTGDHAVIGISSFLTGLGFYCLLKRRKRNS